MFVCEKVATIRISYVVSLIANSAEVFSQKILVIFKRNVFLKVWVQTTA